MKKVVICPFCRAYFYVDENEKDEFCSQCGQYIENIQDLLKKNRTSKERSRSKMLVGTSNKKNTDEVSTYYDFTQGTKPKSKKASKPYNKSHHDIQDLSNESKNENKIKKTISLKSDKENNDSYVEYQVEINPQFFEDLSSTPKRKITKDGSLTKKPITDQYQALDEIVLKKVLRKRYSSTKTGSNSRAKKNMLEYPFQTNNKTENQDTVHDTFMRKGYLYQDEKSNEPNLSEYGTGCGCLSFIVVFIFLSYYSSSIFSAVLIAFIVMIFVFNFTVKK